MKYLLLTYHDESRWAALTPLEKQAITFARRPYDEELRRGGHLVARGYLTTRRGATELCTRNGSLLTNERPAGPTDGDLESIALIEARDLNEAIRVASNHPAAHIGAELGWRVEVWPFERFEQADELEGIEHP